MIFRAEDGFNRFVDALEVLSDNPVVRKYNVSVIQYVVYPGGKSAGVTPVAQQPFRFYWPKPLSKENRRERFMSLLKNTVEYSIKSKCCTVISDQGNGALPQNWEKVIDARIASSYIEDLKVNIPENIARHPRFNLLLMHEFTLPEWNVRLPSNITTIMDFPFEFKEVGEKT